MMLWMTIIDVSIENKDQNIVVVIMCICILLCIGYASEINHKRGAW